MQKLPENKTRKNLRIAQCVLYLIQIVLCTFTYVRIPNPDNPGEYLYRTVPDMLAYMGASFDVGQDAMHAYVPSYLIFFIIPIVGFFFCALDKQRNLKNIVSLFCCMLGVLSILMIVTINFLDIGSTLALLLYLLISFLTTIAIMARLTKDDNT